MPVKREPHSSTFTAIEDSHWNWDLHYLFQVTAAVLLLLHGNLAWLPRRVWLVSRVSGLKQHVWFRCIPISCRAAQSQRVTTIGWNLYKYWVPLPQRVVIGYLLLESGRLPLMVTLKPRAIGSENVNQHVNGTRGRKRFGFQISWWISH